MSYEECKVCGVEFEEPKTIGYCDECWKERRKHKYVVEIDPPTWGDEYYASLSVAKNYGDYHGSGGNVLSKDQLLAEVKTAIKLWEGYDCILGRSGDKVTRKNLFFYSFTKDVTKMEVLGNKKLTSF